MPVASVADYLALERTRLANERTLLAYTRTALGLDAAGATLMHLDYLVPGGLLLGAGAFVLLYGARRFSRVRRQLATYFPSDA